MKKKEPIPHQEGLHIVTKESRVAATIGVGEEGRITCTVMDGDRSIAVFNGATAPQRAAECLKLAQSQKERGVPIIQTTRCVADGVSLRKICKDNELRIQ